TWVAQHGDEDFVELQVTAAGVREGAHRLAIGGAEIDKKLIEDRIGIGTDGVAADATVKRRRRRDGHLRRAGGPRFDEKEVLKHRMARKAELADDTRALRPGLHPGERHAPLHRIAFDAIKAPQEIEVPPRAAEFPVRDRFQAALFLLAD